jgi:hypothetical protein
MAIEIGLTNECVNTRYAPIAALWVHYQQTQALQPLQKVEIWAKKRAFSPLDKLLQVLLSIFTDCETLVEVNAKLSTEGPLARVWGWSRFADQSTLSRQLDQISLKQLDQLRSATTQIWRNHSQTRQHDWRGYLWLDYDFSPLPCGPQAEASQKGYFGEKKRPGTPVSSGECGQVPGNGLVGCVSG